MFKWIALSALGFLIFVVVGINIVYFKNKRQKLYYQNIIDSSSNIVIVVAKKEILYVNKRFFDFFYRYKTLDEFKKDHSSISNLFVKEDGYIYESEINWLESLIKDPLNNQVKIYYDSKEYYFCVGISLISEQDFRYSAIFTDITKEKIYQKELEIINITDTLTKIRNRHYYNQEIKKEIANSNRYDYPLSLVIFDIDHFKDINDKYGHDVGDNILCEYTKFISSNLRKGDIFCRSCCKI